MYVYTALQTVAMMAGGTDLYEVSLTDVVEGNEIDTLSMHTLVLQGGRGGRGGRGGKGRRGEGGEGGEERRGVQKEQASISSDCYCLL